MARNKNGDELICSGTGVSPVFLLNRSRAGRPCHCLAQCNMLFLGAFLLGCHSLPSGDLHRIDAVSHPQVYLLRGWQDLYSSGVDDLATKLNRAGVDAQVFRAAQWRELARSIEQSPSARTVPIALIGFSYGADDTIRIAQELGRHDIKVELIITIDPVTPPPVPSNVRQCINYFESNGFWDAFPWFRGIPLKAAEDAPRVINQNLRTDRRDLLEPGTSHQTIAGNQKLQEEIVMHVRKFNSKSDQALHEPAVPR